MYGDDLPETNILIPILSREYIDHDGILGYSENSTSSEFIGTFPCWRMKKQGKGVTLDDVKDGITELITNKQDVMKERDTAGRSPLHLICCIHSPGQIDVVRAMCSAKSANINVLDTMHRTPLHYVLSPYNLEYYSKRSDNADSLIALLRLLLKLGAAVNAVDIQGVAPIHLALDFHRTGCPENLKELRDVLEILKESGADTNKIAYSLSFRVGTSGQIRSSLTPLHLACRMDGRGSLDAIKSLVSPENINRQDSLGRTPLHTVIMSLCKTLRNIPFIRDMVLPSESKLVMEKVTTLLESGADVNVEDIDCLSPILTAIDLYNYQYSVDIIIKLLHHGALVTRRDRERRTPLHLACQNFDRSLPELLPHFIREGARLNVPDHKLCTPFHYALKKKCCSVATLKVLVDAGAKVTAVDEGDNNCIHIVCSHRQTHFKSVLEFLIDKGCSVNAVNAHGNPPLLHLLQSDYDKDSVQTLIDLGADCHFKNSESISPLHLVCRSLAPSKGSADIVELMLRSGADVNVRDRSLSTALFYAVKDEPTVDKNVVHLLLLAGADPNLANDQGITPLHMVCSYGNHELAKLLIAFKANVNQVNEKGDTPLHEAARAKSGSPSATCQILVDAGANFAAQNRKRCTPFLMTSIYSDSYRFLVGHMVLLLNAGKYSMTPNEMNQLNRNKVLSNFYTDCFSCVSAMDSYKLGSTRFTLSSFLLASPKEARRYTKNSEILKHLFAVADKYPRFRPYSQTIRDKANDCDRFFYFFDRSVCALERIFPESNFPLIVSEKIVSNLNEFEMQSVSIAVFGR